MTGMWTEHGLEYFAPGLWDFEISPISSLATEILESEVSMWNFSARDLFHNAFDESQRRLVRQFIRRSASAARHYEKIREGLGEYFDQHSRSNPKVDIYYRSLDEAETCILHSQVAGESLHYLNAAGTVDLPFLEISKKAGDLADGIKHYGQLFSKAKSKPDQILPLWFYTEGLLGIKKSKVTFHELHSLLGQYLAICKLIRDN